MAELRLVLVTPEKTLFDQPVASIRVPLYDGSAGFLPGRAPLVGRLGIGELRVSDAGGATESWFIDGGFVQVKGPRVSVLTNSALPVSEISRKNAEEELVAAKAAKATTEAEFRAAARGFERARRMLSLAGKE